MYTLEFYKTLFSDIGLLKELLIQPRLIIFWLIFFLLLLFLIYKFRWKENIIEKFIIFILLFLIIFFFLPIYSVFFFDIENLKLISANKNSIWLLFLIIIWMIIYVYSFWWKNNIYIKIIFFLVIFWFLLYLYPYYVLIFAG